MNFWPFTRRRRSAGRAYEGAGAGRRTEGWVVQGTSANAEVGRGAKTLRDRARDLVRNDSHARKGVDSFTRHVVGTGIWPQFQTGIPELDQRAEDLFEEWVEQSDATGVLDFYGQQTQAVRGMIESGESLTRRRPRRVEDELAVPLQLQVLEADVLDHTKTLALPNNGRIVQGVEFDAIGRRSGFWILPEHPGESLVTGAVLRFREARRVDAGEVAHLYDPSRPGQVRGVTWLHAVVIALRELGDYTGAEIMRKKIESCHVGLVFDPNEEGLPENENAAVVDKDGNPIVKMGPGLFGFVRGGKDVKFNQPSAGGNYPAFVSAKLQEIAAGAGVPYEVLTGDLSRVNYSSIRFGMLEFWLLVRCVQEQLVIPQFCRPTLRWWLDAAIAMGRLPDRRYPVKWHLPRREEVDRVKAAQADLLELRNGTTSLPQIIAERGGDADKVLDEIEETLKKLDEKGIVLESDARHDIGKLTASLLGMPDEPERPPAQGPGPGP